MYFDLTFDKNTSYDDKPHPRLARDNEGTGENKGKFFFYSAKDGAGIRSLAVDFYSALTPNRSYMMLIQINDGNQATAQDFADGINDACAISTPFYVTAQTLLRVNGEVVDPRTDFCAGQIFSFSAQVRIPQSDDDGSESYIIVDKGVYFDWFFGSEEEFLAENQKYEAESLENALKTFRDIYPDKENLEGVTAGEHIIDEQGHTVNLSQNAIDLIASYIKIPGPEGGMNNRLVLHKDKIDITLLPSGLDLVVQPIPTRVPPSDKIDEKLWANVCWSYIPLHLNASGAAPQLRAGFNPLKYPSDEFNPGLRIGLDQIINTTSERPLKVNLRGATFVTESAESLGLITSVSPDVFNKIYLIRTNDPAYNNDTYFPEDFGEYSLPVGTIKSLQAKDYTKYPNFDDHMEIYFDTKTKQPNGFQFQPKEGYFYELAFHFEEKMGEGGSSGNSCFGVFNIVMKVVPEYLVWSGGSTSNWNNDDNWKRADKARLLKSNGDSYLTNEANKTDNGYVPMLFSKVIIPANSKVELYVSGFGDLGNSWVNSGRPTHMLPPTEDIQYDLMAFDHPINDPDFSGQLKTERYRVSLLNQIHFEPGAEMLHAEYLLYDTAWVDYQLDKGRWYTLASPLKAVYAGDFYTDKSGTEENEYFQPIYYSEEYNSRFNPSVYQRGWKGSSATMVGTPDGERAIAGNWSALYNKVDEAYTPSTGFSLKVQDIADNSSAIFRLPKADGSYKYYPYGDSQSGDETSVSRVEGEGEEEEKVSGRLQSDQLFIRNTDIDKAGKGAPIEITLSETADGDYYLIGNPFMAHLDMDAFFKEQMFNNIQINNGEVLAWKYWYLDDDGTQVAVSYDEDKGEWVSDKENDIFLIPPLRSFFVVKKTEAENNVIKFTQDMQTLGGDGDGLRSANALIITATTSDGRTSRAAVAYSGMASDDYQSSEDAELFLDSNLGDVPMVYTVAGTMASSINVRQNCELVPLGVYGTDDEPVTLRFDQVDAFSGVKLYDAQTKRYTSLTEGSEVSVSTNDYGRYYLTGGLATGSEAIRTVDDISIYSVRSGEIVATSAGSSLRSVRVYGIGGELVTQQSLANQSVYRLRVPGNAIYVVYAEDMDGIIRNVKLRVR